MIFMKLNKKKHPRFNVPNAGAPNRKRVPMRWRKQRGIDSKKRVKKDFAGAEPTIGYGNPESVKHVKVNGRRSVLIQNMNELKQMISNPDIEPVDVTLARTLSKRKRIEMVKLAKENKINVTNGAV